LVTRFVALLKGESNRPFQQNCSVAVHAQNKMTGGGAILACYCDYLRMAIRTDIKRKWLFSCSAATLTLIDFVTLFA
jgi:hypothetical protein